MPTGDLCTLSDVQTYLGDASAPAVPILQALIAQVSDWVEGFCERNFHGIQSYTWLTDGHGGDTLPLPNSPVISVTSVIIDGVAVTASSGAPAAGYLADERSVSILGGQFTRGRKNVTISYTAGYTYTFTAGAAPTQDTIVGVPGDLRFAVIETVALRFKRRNKIGLNSEGNAGQTTSYDNSMAPKDALAILNIYRKNVPW